MSAGTTIQWTDRTWNPVRGCSRTSPGCVNCYAERQAARFSAPGAPFHEFVRWRSRVSGLDYASRGAAGSADPRWTGKLALVESKLREPLSWREPQRVFVNSMSDLFHEALPDEAIDKVFAVMAACESITFQVLTKRAKRMREYFAAGDELWDSRWPRAMNLLLGECEPTTFPLPNVWLGVSAEDQQRADERIPLLLDTPAAVRFVSAEPLLGPVNLDRVRYAPIENAYVPALTADRRMGCMIVDQRNRGSSPIFPRLDWVIVGGESGPGARPCDVAWIRSIVQQCAAACVPCFVKQLGAHVVCRNDRVSDWLDECGGITLDERELDRKTHQGDTFRVYLESRKGGEPAEWPADLRVREFPAARETSIA